MKQQLFFVSKGKMYIASGGKMKEIPSAVLAHAVEQTKASAKRDAWKKSGEGAKFTGVYEPDSDAASRVAGIWSNVSCVTFAEDRLIYSIAIDQTAGIYSKRSMTDGDEGIVLADSDYHYLEFDVRHGKMAVTAEFAGECHLGISALNGQCRMITEGESIEASPSWSLSDEDILYYSSAGLSIDPSEPNETREQNSPFSMMKMAAGEVYSRAVGPAGVYRMNVRSGEIDEIASDPAYDHVKPREGEDGSLYYIRRPYKAEKPRRGSCLLDILLLPFRLIGALFGFLNVFTMIYSGKTLRSGSGAAKQKSEADLYIEGNLIDAEKSLKQTANEQNPGIIPSSWELIRRYPDGKTEVVRKGVMAFALDGEDIYISNGLHIIRRTPDGQEEKILKADQVTYIS